MSECEEVSAAVVLAGGRNRRFPELKSFINIEGTPIIAGNLRLLKELFREVFISTNDPGPYFELAGHFGATLVGDVLASRGPMSGIYSALINAKGPGVFVVACDMPFLNREVITFIRQRRLRYCGEYGPCDAVVPVFNNKPQPLSGIYSQTLLPVLEDAVMHEKTSMVRFLRDVRTYFIDEPDIREIDPEGRSFVNINTVEDYEAINKRIWKEDLLLR
ncbi:MAG: molybdenum cofactor guanylyltransferase [Nitrospirae bacterium]|nr:molybdenum cofactor guanylyltransferase [Nitrospirota bacterium]